MSQVQWNLTAGRIATSICALGLFVGGCGIPQDDERAADEQAEFAQQPVPPPPPTPTPTPTPTPQAPVPAIPAATLPGTPLPGTPLPGTPLPGTPLPGTQVPTPRPGSAKEAACAVAYTECLSESWMKVLLAGLGPVTECTRQAEACGLFENAPDAGTGVTPTCGFELSECYLKNPMQPSKCDGICK